MFRLDGKIALVTGGGSGIGRAVAQTYARQGAALWIGDVDQDAGKAVADGINQAGDKARFVDLDVTNAESVERAFGEITTSAGRLDVLVNNAGVSHIGTVLEVEEADWDRVMAVNAKGVYLCSRAAVARMKAQHPPGGVIVNMASIASLIAVPERFLYSATKGAVIQMTRCLALDQVKDNIRCNCICPARVHTPFVDDYLKKNYPGREQEMFDQLAAYQPIGRMGEPEEVAALAVYLASDEAAFVTGAAYPIDGGVTAQ